MTKTTIKIAGALLSALVLFLAPACGAGKPAPVRPEAASRAGLIARSIELVAGQRAALIVSADSSQSAFVLPDKTIVVSKGLLDACESDDEIAFVIAHEVAHIVSRDHAGGKKPGLSGATLPSAQQREINADRMAVIYMRAAGYDPVFGVRILYRVAPEPARAFTERIDSLLAHISR